MLHRIEGDIHAFLKEIGISQVVRSAAKAMNYGIGKMTNVITMQGDELEIVSWTPRGNRAIKFILDGTEQRTFDPVEGRVLIAFSRWEEGFDAISVDTRREDTGEPCPTMRRFMREDEMCVEQTTPSGATMVRRWFVRNSGARAGEG